MCKPRKTRKDLPLWAEFDLDIDKKLLLESYKDFENDWVNVAKANPALCENHTKLQDMFSYYEEVVLTTTSKEFSPTQSVKERIRRKEEMYWNVPTIKFFNSYFKEVTSMFRAPHTRVRLTKLPPGKEMILHIDYDPTYAVRVVVPIFTSEAVINLFRKNGKVSKCYFEPYKAYFLNTGYEHGVVNNGTEDRIALIFSLDGQEDLERFKNDL